MLTSLNNEIFFWLSKLLPLSYPFSLLYLPKWYEGMVYTATSYFIIYYYIVSFLSNSLINFAVAKNKGNFTIYYLGSLVARFLLSIIMAFLFMILR
jgi:hypothetical protein